MTNYFGTNTLRCETAHSYVDSSRGTLVTVTSTLHVCTPWGVRVSFRPLFGTQSDSTLHEPVSGLREVSATLQSLLDYGGTVCRAPSKVFHRSLCDPPFEE